VEILLVEAELGVTLALVDKVGELVGHKMGVMVLVEAVLAVSLGL
jgi:hypothetical protein